jgi:V/A-type H+-transporting ATPase subunit E
MEMDVNIQKLTDKIYHEGVEKGNEEATRIIADANTQKHVILEEAEIKAKQILEAAKKQAAEWKKNTEAELKLFASQSVEALKSEVTNLITGKIVSDNIKPVVADKTFIQQVILEIAKEWIKTDGLTIRTSDATALTEYFVANAKELLNQGLQIKEVHGKKTSFDLLPSDGSYKITFGEEEFIAFFKEFLRPQLVTMLF